MKKVIALIALSLSLGACAPAQGSSPTPRPEKPVPTATDLPYRHFQFNTTCENQVDGDATCIEGEGPDWHLDFRNGDILDLNVCVTIEPFKADQQFPCIYDSLKQGNKKQGKNRYHVFTGDPEIVNG
jgi:hypothetical protein